MKVRSWAKADFGIWGIYIDELNLAVQQAKASIAAQEAIVAKLQAGSRPEEIGQASARVTSAEAALAQSKQEAEVTKII